MKNFKVMLAVLGLSLGALQLEAAGSKAKMRRDTKSMNSSAQGKKAHKGKKKTGSKKKTARKNKAAMLP